MTFSCRLNAILLALSTETHAWASMLDGSGFMEVNSRKIHTKKISGIS